MEQDEVESGTDNKSAVMTFFWHNSVRSHKFIITSKLLKSEVIFMDCNGRE